MDKTLKEHLRAAEREYLLAAMQEAHGNVAVAAEMAGLKRGTGFYRKLYRADIYPARFRERK